MNGSLRLFVLIGVVNAGLFAQDSRGLYTPPPVLSRLERLQEHEDVCALIQRTGDYRLERRYAAKLEVFDGSLSPSELEEFNRILDAPELRNISRNDIPHPMIGDAIDTFLIDVYRADGEQHLNFNGPDVRKRFRLGTDPVLKWLDKLPKLQHKQMSESDASHCMPAPLRQNFKPGDQTKRLNSKTYLMSLIHDHVREATVERNCVIVYADGQYRREKSIQQYLGRLQVHAYEGSLSPEQVAQLRALLDAPELKEMKHDIEPNVFSSEADATSLAVPRDSTTQRLKFAHAFQVLGDRDKPGGYSGMQYVLDPDERMLNPLRDWIASNIDNQNVNPVAGSLPTNCDPGRELSAPKK